MQELDPRKEKILGIIVDTYTRTGEPVGSKLIARLLDGSVSPATIRNDMAALFDLGLLEQPHTSAGRVPSHLGYRVYLDQLMEEEPLTPRQQQEIEALFNLRNPDPEQLLEDAAKALARFTHYAVVSTSLTKPTAAVKRIQLIPADQYTVVILLTATGGIIRSRVVRVGFRLTPKIVEFLQNFANGQLAGRSLNDITDGYVRSMSLSLGEEYSDIFDPILGALYELCRDCCGGQFYRSGTTNLLDYDELRQVANRLFRSIANGDALLGLLDREREGIQVVIGKENPRSEFADSTVIFSTYKIGEDNTGAIGLIGPVRMDYPRLIPHLEYFSKTLGRLLSDTLNEE